MYENDKFNSPHNKHQSTPGHVHIIDRGNHLHSVKHFFHIHSAAHQDLHRAEEKQKYVRSVMVATRV